MKLRPKPPLPKIGMTHSGVFHADDVCATAFLKLINPDLRVIRVNSVSEKDKKDPETVAYDIGGGKFDHHTYTEYRFPYNESGPFAAFGKVVREYGAYFFDTDAELTQFDKQFVRKIDMHDVNGYLYKNEDGFRMPNEFSCVISAFNPLWSDSQSPETYQKAFDEAVDMAKNVIIRYIRDIKADSQAYDLSAEYHARTMTRYLNLHNCIVMDKYMPSSKYTVEWKDICWVVYPSARDSGWQIYSVRDRDGSNRQLIPEEIVKKAQSDPCVSFIHMDRFTMVCTQLEIAIGYLEWMQKYQDGEIAR